MAPLTRKVFGSEGSIEFTRQARKASSSVSSASSRSIPPPKSKSCGKGAPPSPERRGKDTDGAPSPEVPPAVETEALPRLAPPILGKSCDDDGGGMSVRFPAPPEKAVDVAAAALVAGGAGERRPVAEDRLWVGCKPTTPGVSATTAAASAKKPRSVAAALAKKSRSVAAELTGAAVDPAGGAAARVGAGKGAAASDRRITAPVLPPPPRAPAVANPFRCLARLSPGWLEPGGSIAADSLDSDAGPRGGVAVRGLLRLPAPSLLWAFRDRLDCVVASSADVSGV